MPRPFKCRNIGFNPDFCIFKPAGIPARDLEFNILSLDELESVRLADMEGLYQEEAAKRMNVSRQTLGNIIASAHKKIADCLINGKALRIQGGNISISISKDNACGKKRNCRRSYTGFNNTEV